MKKLLVAIISLFILLGIGAFYLGTAETVITQKDVVRTISLEETKP